MRIQTTSGYSSGPSPVQLWLWWRLWLLQRHQCQLHQDRGHKEDWDLWWGTVVQVIWRPAQVNVLPWSLLAFEPMGKKLCRGASSTGELPPPPRLSPNPQPNPGWGVYCLGDCLLTISPIKSQVKCFVQNKVSSGSANPTCKRKKRGEGMFNLIYNVDKTEWK